MADNVKKEQAEGQGQLDLEADDDFIERKKEEALARRKKRLKSEDATVQITSLMDITTILLFFLMVSISSDPLNVKVETGMQLSVSTASVTPGDDSLPIIITRDSIVVDNKGIVSINCTIDKTDCTTQDYEKLNKCEADPEEEICKREIKFWVDNQDKERSDASSLVIEPLRKELDRVVKQQMAEDEALGRKFKGVVTLIADKEIPFRLLMEVIYTAGKVGVRDKGGLSEFRFAVMKLGV